MMKMHFEVTFKAPNDREVFKSFLNVEAHNAIYAIEAAARYAINGLRGTGYCGELVSLTVTSFKVGA